jgi:WD40 repeat protein
VKPSFLIAFLFAAPTAQAVDLDFYRDVYPFLKVNCISCHNKTTTKAGLNMETPELMKQGGDSGPGLIPGKGAESLVVLAAKHEQDLEMPPANNKSDAVDLTPAEIALLTAWIDQGAKSSVQEERQVVWQALAAGVHPIYAVALSADGRFAACGRSNEIALYDLATRQPLAAIAEGEGAGATAHRALVQALAFSPDGQRLASGSFREVKVWRQQPSPEVSAETVPERAVDEALIKRLAAAAKVSLLNQALSADGRLVAAGGADGAVRVWEVAGAKLVAELRVRAADRQRQAELDWAIAREALEQVNHNAEVTRMEAQNKALDELLKKAKDAMVAMEKTLPEKEKAVKPAEEAKAAAERAVVEVKAKIAALAEGQEAAALAKQLTEAEDKLVTASAALTAALAGVSATQSNIEDARADEQRITASQAENATQLTAAKAASAAAKALQDEAAAALKALKTAMTKPSSTPVAVALAADGQTVAGLFDDGTLNVWAVATGSPVEQVQVELGTLAAGTQGGFVVTTEAGKRQPTAPVGRWVLERVIGREKAAGLFVDRVNAVRFSPDGKTLATGGGELSRSGDVHLFDVASGKLLSAWKERHDDAVLSLDFSPDGKLLASGASDKIAKVTEVQSGKVVQLFEGHTHYVMGVAFRADARVLATAGADGVVLTWDMTLGERKTKIEGWTKEVTSLQFMGATNQIVTSAGDNRVRIVTDAGTEIRALSKLPDFMQAAAISPDGATLIGGGEDSVLRVWDGANGKELAAFGGR